VGEEDGGDGGGGGGKALLGEDGAEKLAAAVEAHGHSAGAAAEKGGGFFLRAAFEVVEEKGDAVFFGQAGQARVEGLQGDCPWFGSAVFRSHFGGFLFMTATNGPGLRRARGDVPGDAVQPADEVAADMAGGGSLGEGEKDGLGGVVGIGRRAQDGAADGQDHAGVAAGDFGERVLVAGAGEDGQEGFVGAGVGEGVRKLRHL